MKNHLSANLSINTNLVRSKLVEFIRNELTRNGFTKVVIGLSGGLDSSLACYLAVEALGSDNVLAICMPYATSSADSLKHADLVINAVNIRSLIMPITGVVDGLIELSSNTNATRKGNIMARARMIILFDQSAANNALVLGTGNKTEILLGYSTIYGDSACGLNPLGDLYKTQVRQLAMAMKVPEVIIHKPPSADLWIGQTDEGELGFTYQLVDQLLFLLIEKEKTPEECVHEGFSSEFVEQVIARVRKNRYKRVMPPIARITVGDAGLNL
ncbi:MAG: NAD+ synthase [Anaerolineaceae bacterium]|nr:NAD+ synthase [Anaerolineaceae bacterium]MBN2677884.1 NAD+ synthase [Anaerolineaceae bacterium]